MFDRYRVFMLIVCGSMGAAGCGGSAGGASCGNVQPCGGSVVGDWKIVNACVDFDFTGVMTDVGGDSCPQATVDVPAVDLTGTASFRADQTYTIAETLGLTMKIGYPAACLGGLTCAQFDAAIQSQLAANPEPTIESYHCAAAGTACNCTLVSAPMARSESGTYTTSGGTISYLASDGSSSSDSYCAQGAQLHLTATPSPGTGPGTDEPAVSGDIVLARQ